MGREKYNSLSCLLVAIALCSVCVPVLVAQTGGTIAGTLTNSSGVAVSEAVVTATSNETGQVRSATTNREGAYNLPVLPPGSYTVRFSAPGQKTIEITGVTLNGEDRVILSYGLTAGPQTENLVERWEGTRAAQPAVTALPLSSRNYTQALGLSAGVSGNVKNASDIGKGTQDVQVVGLKTSNYSLDGILIGSSGGFISIAGMAIPNPDAIQEVAIQSSAYDAGVHRSASGNVNVLTKSGTNSFHGSIFEFVRNDIFNANEFFLNRTGQSRPVLKQNQFGFSLGGPIIKDKLLIFGSYQGTRQRNGLAAAGFSPNVTLPPLPQTRTAAAVGAAICPANHPNDRRFTTFFGGTQVACDGSNINPVALNFLNLKLPDGSYFIPGSGTATFQTIPYSIPAKFTEDQFLINTDLVLSTRHTLTEKFLFSRAPQLSSFNTGTGASTGSGNSVPGSPLDILYQNLSVALKLASVVNNNLANELRLSFQHDIGNLTPLSPFTNQQVGITSLVPEIDMVDVISISGLFNTGGSAMNWQRAANDHYIVSDQLSWLHGKQTIRAGLEVIRRQLNSQTLGWSRGTLTFLSFPDFLLGLPGCQPGLNTCDALKTNGSAFSNVFATTGVLSGPDGIHHAPRMTDYSAFIQDDIVINSRLTLNAGVRWDYFDLPVDISGNNTNMWPRLIQAESVLPAEGSYVGWVVPGNFNGVLPQGVYKNTRETAASVSPSWRNYSPRLSFAWQVTGNSRLVVRGGYGYFYNHPDVDTMTTFSQINPPYGTLASSSGAANYFSSLAQPFASNIPLWGNPRKVDFSTGQSSNLSARLQAEDIRVPITQKWNLDIQSEIFPKWVLVIGYTGSHSLHLITAARQINAALLGSPSNPVNGVTTNTVANSSLRVPYLGIAPKGMDFQGNIAAAKYNSLQVSLRKGLSRGVQLGVAYTFSKTLTNSSNTNNPVDFSQQYGRDSASRPHRFVLNYRWELPYNSSGNLGWLFGGWSLSGVTAIQSGPPMTITDGRGGTIYGSASTSRAQLCPGVSNSDLATSGSAKQRLDQYFNPTAFCSPPSIGNGTGYGNLGVGTILGPGQSNWDLSMNKSVRIHESRVELRVEFFNMFNHAQFSNPNVSVSDAPFGKITSTSVNPRLIQFGVKYLF